MQDVNRTSATRGTDRAQAAKIAAQEAEHRLTRQESTLLLGAFFVLSASIASFFTL